MDSVKVLGIAGSPRKEGNTDILLAEALKGARDCGVETEVVYLRDLMISPCMGCHVCETRGACVQHDDITMLYPKLVQADHIILASPIQFYNVSSQAKLMIDRCQCLWAKKYVRHEPVSEKEVERRGAFISVGATKGKNLFEGTKLTVKYFFDAIDVVYYNDLLIRQVDRKGDIKEHPDYLKQAYELGKMILKGEG